MKRRKLRIRLVVFLLMTCVEGTGATAGDAIRNASGAPWSSGASGAAPLVTEWEQATVSGFGVPGTLEATAVELFNGDLYAGTWNPVDPGPLFDGAQIFRSPDGSTWTAVTQPGFGSAHDNAPPAILDFVVFNGRLYAGTGRGNASQVWRSLDGTTWAPMNVTGFSDPDNVNVTAFAVYGGMIYAGVTNQVTGAQVWRSFSGDNNTWVQVAPTDPGTAPASITAFAEFPLDGGLYAAVEFEADAPAQVWRSYGGDWEIVISDGFGDNATLSTGGMAAFQGSLYVGAGNENSGAQLWRSSDGNIWTAAVPPGSGDPNNQEIEMVAVLQDRLCASVRDGVTGIEIWRTADGLLWEQVSPGGFGDSNNTGTNHSNATAAFDGRLYVGTLNTVDGGELWRTMSVTGVDGPPGPPATYALGSAVPNPSASDSRIPFDLPRESPISLRLFDARGRLVRTLAREVRRAGSHSILWDGRDDAGGTVVPGVYFYQLRAGTFASTGRLVVVR